MQSLLVRALFRQPVSHPPLWLMRQAGRYLPEYRAVRAKFPNFLEFCLHTQAATEVTLQPVQRFNLDAAIIFADILTIPHALGHTVTFTEGEGPHVTPITTPQQVEALAQHLPELPHKLAAVSNTVANTRAALPQQKAVIGFSGAPFTLVCYMLDAKPSQGIPNTLAFAQNHPQAFAQLVQTLTQAIISYLQSQATAGASALQLFDSWALLCPPNLWQTAVEQPLLAIGRALHASHPQTPVILFPRGVTQQQLQSLAAQSAGAFHGLSLSTEHNLAWAHQTLQPQVAIQGNLNPELMTGAPEPLRQAAQTMLNTAATQPGYIVNLGHGLTPQTNPDNVKLLADLVRSYSTISS